MRALNFIRSRKAAAGDVLWLFVHIPKTAGSSFRNTLAQHLQPEHNINITNLRGTHLRGMGGRAEAFGKAIDEFLSLDREQRFVFASGHLNMAEAVRIREEISRPVRLLTMLRDPVQRVISDYRYQRTPAHTNHEAFGVAFPTLESFAESHRSQNKMFRYLALPGETLEAATARIERDFSLVGAADMYPLSIRLCSELIGPKFTPKARLNPTQDTGDNDVEVSDDLSDRIRKLNRKDQHVWDHFRERLERT
jgi:hypothetical protein